MSSTSFEAPDARFGTPGADDLQDFRQAAAQFLADSKDSGMACPAYGAILVPALHDQAKAWQQHCFANAWSGLHWPTEHGGQGLTRSHTAVWMEECERAGVAPYLNLQGIVLAGEAILRTGTPAQQARFLRPTIAGEVLWCQLFSEPGAGSDLAGLSTSARRDGERFILNGQKVWSSNAQFADFGILMARSEPDAPKHKGISFFLLDMSLPGIQVRPIKQMTGDQEFCEVFFTDVEMPAEALLGDPGSGWSVAMAVLEDERGGAGSSRVISLGKRLAQMQQSASRPGAAADGSAGTATKQHALMELFAAGQALSFLMQRSDGNPAMAPVSKLLGAELGYLEAQINVDLQGAAALLDSDSVTRFLYAPGMRIAGGTNEIQKNIIGERVLGLPREPSSQS